MLTNTRAAHKKSSAAVNNYPDFTWDTVPRFAFLSLTSHEDLSEERARFLAQRFPIVTICKHDPKDPGKTIEQETIRAARRIKAVNPKAKVLYYWNTVLAHAGSRAISIFSANDSWALRDKDNQYVTLHGLKMFDVTKPEVREWWSSFCAEMAKESSIDGIFADAVCKYGMKNAGFERALRPGKRQALADGLCKMLSLAQRKMESGKLLIFNGMRGDLNAWHDGGFTYLKHSSGAMVEHFASFSSRDENGRLDKECLAHDIELIGKAADDGKIVLVKGWPGNHSWLSPGFAALSADERKRMLNENIAFPLAAFLVAAEKNCYFGYTFGYLSDHGLFEPLDELNRPLGRPRGKATRDGWEYRREFEHASVWLDIENEKATIDWRSTDKGASKTPPEESSSPQYKHSP